MGLENLNRFVVNPTSLDMPRSKFKRPYSNKTTFKSGELVPVMVDEILPGDTVKLSVASVIRSITPAVPVMDNAFVDVFFFFVPNRLCTFGKDDWQKICGENTSGYWANNTEHSLVSTGNYIDLAYAYDGIKAGSLLNHLGLPIESGSYDNGAIISTLPILGYVKIWNEWFRDQNVQAPLIFNSSSDLESNFVGSSNNLSQVCLSVNKLHDYFTSCLPSPQKGDSVLLPLGALAPVITTNVDIDVSGNPAMKLGKVNAGGAVDAGYLINGSSGVSSVGLSGVTQTDTPRPNAPMNLYADLANATAASVNQLREAFAIQRMLEKDARGGTRYREMLKAHFGVTIPDATIQVPEYLGGKRVPLGVSQVLSTAEGSDSVIGQTGAVSHTAFADSIFTKSFTEFGYLYALACVRPVQTYSQGISKMWTRMRRYEFYDPSFANLGEQAVMKRELYAPYNADEGYFDNVVFGYQEAWAEYRYKPSDVSGYLAPAAGDNTLTAWTYTNNFSTAPTLNSDFMVQDSSQIGDTLVVTDSPYQFIGDFYFDMVFVRVMPVYSIPGLKDHH